MERVTDGVAVGAFTSPLWLDWFMTVSEFFGACLPIVGTIWIVYQLVTHIITSRKKGNLEGREELKKEIKERVDGI